MPGPLQPAEAAAELNAAAGRKNLALSFKAQGQFAVAEINAEQYNNLKNSVQRGGPALSELMGGNGSADVVEVKQPGAAAAKARTGRIIGSIAGGVLGGRVGAQDGAVIGAEAGRDSAVGTAKYYIKVDRVTKEQVAAFESRAEAMKLTESGKFAEARAALSATADGKAGPAAAPGDDAALEKAAKEIKSTQLTFKVENHAIVSSLNAEQAENLQKALKGLTPEEKTKIFGSEKPTVKYEVDGDGKVTGGTITVTDPEKFGKYSGAADIAVISGDPALVKKAIANAEKAPAKAAMVEPEAQPHHGLSGAAQALAQGGARTVGG